MTAGEWLERLGEPGAGAQPALSSVYGPNPEVLSCRLELLRKTIAKHLERFGDGPLGLFRCPGRVNLRGMHVDTHGGYLNLMTHQREVVVAARPVSDDRVVVANIDPRFEEVAFGIDEFSQHGAFQENWLTFITHPDVQNRVLAQRGHWGNYLKGAVLSARHRHGNATCNGFHAVVGSDLPRGAALSSSTALSVAVFLAAQGCNGLSLDDESLILAVKDAEWYTGARGGISDQSAMILGGRDELVNAALLSSDLDTSTARRAQFPDELRVLVINSHTERSLSGAQLVEYTRNRFAYSLAMAIIRQEMKAQGVDETLLAHADRLAHLSPMFFEELGGASFLYRLLQRIPDEIDLDELRARYDLPELDAAYEQYFGTAPPELRPTRIGLRGPLLFGIAESERARLFIEVLQQGNFARTGRLMSAGHDGDRRVRRDGTAFSFDCSHDALEQAIVRGTPIELLPGAYGASSPVLDTLVDTALDAGALGASLTGAGIAGAVLALCRREDVDGVASAVRERLASEDYARIAKWDAPLAQDQLEEAVIENHAPAAAGELVLTGSGGL